MERFATDFNVVKHSNLEYPLDYFSLTNDENEQYDNARLSESWISMGEADINGDRGHYDCYSYVLYRPDCSIFDSIRKLTLMEYIYRKLEMFNMNIDEHIEDQTAE